MADGDLAIHAPPGVAGMAAMEGKPNIVFIMTDDHAVSALGAYGNKLVRTPADWRKSVY